jgi:NAD(P)H dehydrogenase (quinone)
MPGAAAAAMLRDDQAGKIYELGGDVPFSFGELAEEVSAAMGKKVTYQDHPVEDYTKALVEAGLPEPYAAVLAESDRGIARGDLLVKGNDLAALIGRPTISMPQAVQAAAKATFAQDGYMIS